MTHVGQALYYPYTHFRDTSWLKIAALYYQDISRIIPDGSLLDDSTEASELLKAGVITRIDPTESAAAVAEEFIEYVYKYLSDPLVRKQLFPELANSGHGFRIQPGKMAAKVREALIDLEMVELPAHGDDFDLDAVTGGVYMAFLAKKISAQTSIPVVTHEPIFQELMYTSAFPKEVSKKEKGALDPTFLLASLVIESVVPQQPEQIPVDLILKFREKHQAERALFYDEVAKLAGSIDLSENKTTVKKFVRAKQEQMLAKANSLEKAFRDVGISTIRDVLFVSSPSWITAKWALNHDHGQLAVAGASVAVALSLFRGYRDIEKAKKESPMSYVLSLRKLKPTLAKRFKDRNRITTLFGKA